MNRDKWDQRRRNRVRRKIYITSMASFVSDNATKPANSTNGLTFEGLMKMLKGEAV